MATLFKYPRTPHLEGSRRQPGDEDLPTVPLQSLRGRHVVIEEKVDGANAAISFTPGGQLLLQSRGHFLSGGARERHFNLFKSWASARQPELWAALGSRYVAYGEWLYAKHTIFYDCLPHYFLEFDVLDTAEGVFLSTAARQSLLKGLPLVAVPVLWSGAAPPEKRLRALRGRSLFKSDRWRENLLGACAAQGLDPERVADQTDQSDLMEGLYIKVEEEGRVVERYKYIRASFLTAVTESDSHWLDRPIVPNRLRAGADIFAQ